MATKTAEEIKRDAEEDRLAARRYPSHQGRQHQPAPVEVTESDPPQIKRLAKKYPSLYHRR